MRITYRNKRIRDKADKTVEPDTLYVQILKIMGLDFIVKNYEFIFNSFKNIK